MLRLRCGPPTDSRPLEAEVRRDRGAPVALVDHVDAVVLAVRAGDAEHHRRPPPDAELLLGERAPEHERSVADDEVDALALLDTVEEDLEGALDVAREPDEGCSTRPVAHVHRMPPTVRPKLLVIAGALVVPLVSAAT